MQSRWASFTAVFLALQFSVANLSAVEPSVNSPQGEERHSSSLEEQGGKSSVCWEVAQWTAILASFGAGYLINQSEPWPVKPLLGGVTNKDYREESVSKIYLIGGVMGMTGAMALLPNNGGGFFNEISYRNTKGILQATSFTFLSTSLIKNIFGRKRPSYDNYPEEDRNIEGRQSFISGDSSISFCLATSEPI